MAQDGSLHDASSIKFDLNSQAGVLSILTSIRNSELNAEDRNELRDLVFLFSNSGGDPAVKSLLEERLVSFNLTQPVASKKTAEKDLKADEVKASETPAKPKSSFAGVRPQPTFSVKGQSPATDIPAPASTPPAAPISVPASTPSVSETPTPTAPTITPTPTQNIAAVRPEPPKIPTPPPVTSTPPKVVTPPPAPVKPTQPAGVVDSDNLNRIREIKASVNDRVGNPVNLVDIDNVVGRDYMNALLDAMKAVSGGTPQGAATAMSKLESTYQVVMSVLDKRDQSLVHEEVEKAPLPDEVNKVAQNISVQVVDETEDKSHKVAVGRAQKKDKLYSHLVAGAHKSEEETTDVDLAEEPDFLVPQSASVGSFAPDVEKPINPTASVTESEASAETKVDNEPEKKSGWAQALASIRLPNKDEDNKEPEQTTFSPHTPDQPAPISAPMTPVSTPSMPVTPTSVATPSPIPAPTPTPNSEQIPSTPVASSVPRPDITPSNIKPNSGSTGTSLPITPVSNTEPLKTPNDLPTADSRRKLSADKIGDPLYSGEVDNGLNQLLSEWSLFKKSGLFGTGPKGREHPLFLKLAELQIPLILAGRFEGSTQEIKQSITDYMNGWRYEQGIIYEPGETFEHYLRRVISHIIGLQT